ncbi:ectonucleotide pyrophosphatase/phosphodiesterase family member 3 [Talpa occidentalis]|uniref:ectonucleotide pyrophosphatase/phosphodiesterase family member 3 n=1 Tax=Talpa occidentalis TaxID=50954 RepID=UPI00188F1125|nr:ectonucleotide pyrophosphatase/phosphodiesterase family member 3 [Talpa occidentalis]XP_037376304.1 ectonucleotide pyrophosphatase/phosphodiesterase family member 3 [Talpa occidentalis]XP_037376305.1 ectonucleotide pyrophosphatase/phosphodiesterase family member 3 [Talpa occidentalis]XP_054553819.1 ectonucleotide pyrophosphatase/phosphodiesterase family member 3 [Talpa occidentalis]
MDPMLTSSTEEAFRKNTVKKYKIISIVLLALLVIVTLGLGLGLGLRKPQEQGSCRKKCFDSSYRGLENCRCDMGCKGRGDCCWDFEDTCVESTQIWTCNKFRCGETRLQSSLCSCSDDCLQRKDCCTDYKSVCQGETPWVKEECATIQKPQCPEGFNLPPVILFSMDGFRAEYLQTWSTLMPNINKLKTCGIHSKYLRPAYPTKTFPNHYTVVTGLYPESHGIIDNNMYDVKLNQNFSLSSATKNNPAWWQGQPIWLTAMYQGLTAGTYFWPGSDVAVNGSFPSKYEPYNKSIAYEERISTVLKWLDLDKGQRPDFYTIYVEQPDSAGHNKGPVSAAVIQALQSVDKIFGMLMEGLKQRNLHNCVNIILLADHGMDQTYCDKVEYMTDYFPQINFYMYEGPAPRIRSRNIPADFYTFDSEGIVRNLSCRKSDQHFKPYLTPDLPKRLHYVNNVRIDKVHLMVDRQWLAVRSKGNTFCGGGNHGYDNEFKSMEAIFVAHGPSFKEKTEVEPFENIEVYNLMCDLLHIRPAPNNGTHGSLNHLLKEPFYKPTHPEEVSKSSTCDFTNSVPTDDLGCKCPELPNDTVLSSVNERLNLKPEEKSATEKLNLPFGRPRVMQENKGHCLLYHRDYISGFGKTIMMPLWSSYTITNPLQGNTLLLLNVSDCLRADVRVAPSESQKCSFYLPDLNITHGFLYPLANNRTPDNKYDTLITSNLVPMYKEFKKIWDYLHSDLLVKHAKEKNGVNVISGPVFDYNSNGHFDSPDEIKGYVSNTSVPIPTHYFVVLTSCKDKIHTPDKCTGPLDVLPYIIPHRHTNVESCPEGKPEALWIEERLEAHVARVRDVELLTGLDFYQERLEPVSEILQLKTYLPTFETVI